MRGLFSHSENPSKLSKTSDHKKQTLLVQVKIKNKQTKSIVIADMYDAHSIDQQIKWFLTTNNLKQEAFTYIKSIITKKIEAKQAICQNLSLSPFSKNANGSYQKSQSNQNSKQMTLTFPKQLSPLEQCHLSRDNIKKQDIYQLSKFQRKIDKEDPISTNYQEQSFNFNSSFTLPSSIGQKQRSLLTDRLFEHAFDTAGKYSEDFTSINQMNQPQELKVHSIYPPLSIKVQQEYPLEEYTFNEKSQEMDKQQKTEKKKSIKITLTKRKKQSVSTVKKSVSPTNKKIISTKQRKNAIFTPKKKQQRCKIKEQFVIYNHENLQQTKNQTKVQEKMNTPPYSVDNIKEQLHLQYLPNYLQEDLKRLFDKLTSNNPHEVSQIHSQFVSYQQLTKQQLIFMGSLFQKINHQELNHLDFTHFKLLSLRYCWKQLQELHLSLLQRQKDKNNWDNSQQSISF